MRVLISAYSCWPRQGSEPGAGWAWTAAATRDHEVWLLTHTGNAPAIDALRAADPRLAARLHPVYRHNPRALQWLRRAGPLRFLYYIAWQLGTCRRTARALHARLEFHVAHHVTFAADWAPAGVAAVPGLPFVWGPVGGSASRGSLLLWVRLGWPVLLSELLRAALLIPLRCIVGRSLARRAAVVVGQNEDVAEAFDPVPVVIEPHVALESLDHSPSARPAEEAPRAIWAGRLLGWKGLRLALAALRRPEAADWQLDIYGDGPERRRLERLTGKWGLGARVRFHGRRSRVEVRQAMARAAVMLFPSVHDAAGWSVAEALDAGCPVVALRAAGPATLVAPGHGVLVEPRGDVVAGLARALHSARGLRPDGVRWRADRLPDLITDLYRRAVGDVESPPVPAQVTPHA